MIGTPALFLDRDGIVNEEVHFCHRIEDLRFRDGIFDLVRAAHAAGRLVVVVTNQSGLARGLFDEDAYYKLTNYMKARFAREGSPLTDVLHCPYHPEAVVARYRMDHPWRKPRPGMLLEAAERHGVDLARSALIGDRPSDIAAAAAARLAAACLVGTSLPDEAPRPANTAQVADVRDAAAWYAAHLLG